MVYGWNHNFCSVIYSSDSIWYRNLYHLAIINAVQQATSKQNLEPAAMESSLQLQVSPSRRCEPVLVWRSCPWWALLNPVVTTTPSSPTRWGWVTTTIHPYRYSGDMGGVAVVELVGSCTRRPKSHREAFCQTPTWGMSNCGAVGTAQQSNVQQIHATCNAFAAILADGTVVTWGVPSCGGDNSPSSA